MSESFIDRFFASWSVDDGDPITRSIGAANTSGFIRDDAPHWSIESYIPMQVDVLIEYLLDRKETTPKIEKAFRDCYCEVESVLRERTGSYHGRFAQQYWPVDPDNDSYNPHDAGRADRFCDPEVENKSLSETEHQGEPGDDRAADQEQIGKDGPDLSAVLELCQEILTEAGYRCLSREDIEKCVGVASQWGVPLHVDFDVFEELLVFARGDVVGTKLRRRLRRLYRPEPVSVPIYQRMFVLFQLKNDDGGEEELRASALHLRMFKNIPKQDVDMLLPGTRVRITKIDRVKIIVPSLGGLLMSLRKIAQFMLIFAALTLYSTAILIGLVLATIGYIVKSVLSYFQTKNRYLLNLTRNLYFQKLDTNAGAAYRVIQQAHRQASLETILAYYAIITSEEPISPRRLRRRCERLVRESIQVEIDFRVDRALERLKEMGRIQQTPDQRWVAS